jgi:sulfite exporter TauE/SafE
VLASQLWYHAGRIATYAMLGALAGGLGHVLQAAGAFVGLQRAALLVAGGVLVVWALLALSEIPWFPRAIRLTASARPGAGPTRTLFGRVAGALKGRVPSHPFAVGLLLGLLPCGLLYSAVVAAVARGGAVQGALALALFGLGTAPALLGISVADALVARRRVLLNRLAQVFILVMGGWFLWRGLAG